jgi:3-deoxy-7-phosphoheptulonate synthase
MRTYLEKPRTTVGWKGFIADPDLDGTHDKNKGLLLSRELLVDITSRHVPIAMELLNESTPVYFDDLTSWGCLGARTVESQTHRELASGVSFPMGHKNNTSGDTKVAVEAVRTAVHPHSAEGINDLGIKTLMETSGNPHNHVILRGSKEGSNYDRETIERVKREYKQIPDLSLEPAIMIDASHQNSDKDHRKQLTVVNAVANHIREGEQAIIGVMLESNLVAGAQKPGKIEGLKYGQSISDGCIDLASTKQAFDILQGAVMMRRQTHLTEADI